MKTVALWFIAFFLLVISVCISENTINKKDLYFEEPSTNIYIENIDSVEYYIFITDYRYDTYINVVKS